MTASDITQYTSGPLDAETLIIFLPGNLDSAQYPHMVSHRVFFASLGYLCVSFDPIGTRNSPGTINEYTISGYLKSIQELIRSYGNRKTILVGHSLGGAMALLTAFENPYVIGTVSIMAPYSLDMHCAQYAEGPRKESGFKISKRDLPEDSTQYKEFNVPYSFVEDALKYNMTQGLADLKIPKLFVAGADDRVVLSKTIEEGYAIASEPKSYVLVAGDHNYRLSTERIAEMNQIIYGFIKERCL